MSSARGFHERGGKPHPCSAKENPETGHVSTPLFQVFGCYPTKNALDASEAPRSKDDAAEVKERKLEQVLERLRTEFIFKTPTDLRDLHYYRDGIYKPAECLVEGLLERELGASASTHFVSEVLEHLRRGSFVDRAEFNRFRGFVPVQNGLLDLETLELKPFNADLIYTYKLNVHFDGSAKCPKWLAFLIANIAC